MKVFRTAPPRWAETEAALFGGDGAAKYPGRWNFEGEHTTYCAETLEVALAEAGFYEIIFHLPPLTGDHLVAPRKVRRRLLNRPRILIVAEFNGIDAHLVDISTADGFDAQCTQHRIRLSLEESRRSDLPLLNNQTRRLARAIRESSAAGLITRSARSNGRCIVIFPTQAPPSVSLDITGRTDISLSASNGDGIWNGRDIRQISQSEVHATHSLDGIMTKKLVSVLSFP